MKADIHRCRLWRDRHDRPVYTLTDTCPECGAEAINTAPAPFDPTDAHGEYRRALKRRTHE